jgi:5-methyltetrahydropteroyltriglutamate--homocysteine methyltransferase
MVVLSSTLGFPRMGPDRELKKALESYWSGSITTAELELVGAQLRERHWRSQAGHGIDLIPSGDFSFYDHVLDTAELLGAVPERHLSAGEPASLDRYFAMARGGSIGGTGVTALEMTKWFDTNYHYLVPELSPGQEFELSSTRPLDQVAEARALGIATRPVLLGPISFLMLSRYLGHRGSSLDLLSNVLPVYAELLVAMEKAGVEWVQMDEPVLGLDLDATERSAFGRAYPLLREVAPTLKVALTTYFSGLGENLPTALALPVAAVHLDVVSDPDQAEEAIARAPEDLVLSLGVVDGRNVWRTDLDATMTRLEAAQKVLGSERLQVGSSCSLLHLPVDLDLEQSTDTELRGWLAFAAQRLEEIAVLARGLNEGRDAIADELRESTRAFEARASSTRVHDPAVRRRMAAHDPSQEQRTSPYRERQPQQTSYLGLPQLPTTSIGSFPQTAEIRRLRSQHLKGRIDAADYEAGMRAAIDEVIAFQEEIGIDVLVHGEPERNDMVEYFGEALGGCLVTSNGWVQSYGSRCVKPPIIYGDITRPRPMTVAWSSYAQSQTTKPVKGMLTGPITILQWSFVRNDQPPADTARQLAFAIRDEVHDLEAAGIRVIQIDEPALREGLPLHRADHEQYLLWAVAAFRLASSGVRDETQIHTHMCYCDFNDVIESIAAFDADVISMEASRSQMELLHAFAEFEYPNEVGPGIWDIHSPRVPDVEEMADNLRAAVKVIPIERLWVNPDCGLKTRRWEEVRPALTNLVEAAHRVRHSNGS